MVYNMRVVFFSESLRRSLLLFLLFSYLTLSQFQHFILLITLDHALLFKVWRHSLGWLGSWKRCIRCWTGAGQVCLFFIRAVSTMLLSGIYICTFSSRTWARHSIATMYKKFLKLCYEFWEKSEIIWNKCWLIKLIST